MKIIADIAMPYVAEAFADFGTVELHPGRAITREIVADADLLLVRSVTKVTPELIAGTGLKFVASATSGIEHVDTAALRERGIGFAYAPGSNANSVAQYVAAALLRLAAKNGQKLADLTLGIIGVGNVGSLVLRTGEALGMRCLLNDPPRKRLTGNEIYKSLDEVVEAADFLTLHVPLNREGPDATCHLVNTSLLDRMKPGAVLMNASRGAVLDEAAVMGARSKLGGLVADVWNHEPSIDPSYLALADIATPHIAGYSFDGKVQGTAMVYKAACRFFHRAPAWSPKKLLSDFAGPIDVSGSEDPVALAVQTAYDLAADDARLRPIAEEPETERGRFFDRLRATYPKRLEFGHFEARCGRSQETQRKILAKLGFKTKMVD
jgi:erythronate-4-phosphate dehydrogenase